MAKCTFDSQVNESMNYTLVMSFLIFSLLSYHIKKPKTNVSYNASEP